MTLRVIQYVLGLERYFNRIPSQSLYPDCYLATGTSADSKNLHRSQIEPSIAMLCACLMTLRPLFVDLNLILSKLPNPFLSRSKDSSLSQNTSSTELIQASISNPQWSGTPDSGPKDSTRSISQGMALKSGLRIITVDLEATERKEPFMQV